MKARGYEIHAQECRCPRCTPDEAHEATLFVAHRAEVYGAAHAMMKRLWGDEELNAEDVYAAALFLAGDNLPGGGISARFQRDSDELADEDDEDDE